MNADDLLRLALRAVDDRAARPVLGDVVLESGWSDPRVMSLLQPQQWLFSGMHVFSGDAPRHRVRTHLRAANLSRKNARNPTARWCRAVAAVLLFGGWTLQRWAIAYDAEAFESRLGMYGGLAAWLPNAYEAVGISPFVGVDRTADPVRLNGIQFRLQEEQDRILERLREAHSRIVYGPTLETLRERVRLASDLGAAQILSDEQVQRLIAQALDEIG